MVPVNKRAVLENDRAWRRHQRDLLAYRHIEELLAKPDLLPHIRARLEKRREQLRIPVMMIPPDI